VQLAPISAHCLAYKLLCMQACRPDLSHVHTCAHTQSIHMHTGLDPELAPGPKQLARFLKQLCNTKPVYGFHIDVALSVESSDGYLYARTFMEYYQVCGSSGLVLHGA